ncbi:MAG: MFS transporter [Syntrophales bacterium]|jgi:MFS family permease|nr:MFS transporter [Syntrophales bacterium]MDD4338905.1 MFS transporter [Syntrophales bacterium]HOG06766.1 MFS transporter [Syntrophales bacterium]HOS77019.1 MFS transporter [Syntrophales bacterium]HPB69589.1 MFS transporter [Syntrophales bacterium]
MNHDAVAPEGSKLSNRSAYYIFTLLFLLYFFDYVDRTIVTSVAPFIREEWDLTDMQSGLLLSVVYWSIVAFVFPVSILVDRWSRKKTVGVMALLWTFATVACAFTKSFPQLLLARGAIGVGEAGYAPAGTAMLSGLFPPEKRSRMMGFWNIAIPLGTAVGIGLGGFIATHWGWRHAFGLVALPGAIIAILFFFVKDYKTVELVKTVGAHDTGKNKIQMSKMDIVREFIHTPSLMLTNVGFIGCIFVNNAIIFWMPTYFHRTGGLSISEAGMKTSLLMVLALVGLPLGGWLADMWFKKRVSARLLFPAITTALNAVAIFIGISLLTGQAQYVTLLLMGVLASAFAPAAITATQEAIHPGLRAISYSLCVVVQNLFGASMAPIVIGKLSDLYGIQTAMSVLPVFLVASALVFLAGSFFYARDLAKVEKVTLEWE